MTITNLAADISADWPGHAHHGTADILRTSSFSHRAITALIPTGGWRAGEIIQPDLSGVSMNLAQRPGRRKGGEGRLRETDATAVGHDLLKGSSCADLPGHRSHDHPATEPKVGRLTMAAISFSAHHEDLLFDKTGICMRRSSGSASVRISRCLLCWPAQRWKRLQAVDQH